MVTPQTTYSVKKTKPTSATKPIKQEKIIFKTAKMLEKETEEVYESLRPTQHQALVDESAEAFEKLDEKVENMELLEKK